MDFFLFLFHSKEKNLFFFICELCIRCLIGSKITVKEAKQVNVPTWRQRTVSHCDCAEMNIIFGLFHIVLTVK
jgi:hypothetical protein